MPRFKFKNLFIPIALIVICYSCINNDDNEPKDYSQWKVSNQDFINAAEKETIDGKLKFEKIIPDWDKSIFALIKWHNDKSVNAAGLVPLSNSTVDIKYILSNINGDTLDSSSHFRCRPNNLISGFWLALTQMHEGDSVTAVLPYIAGYGENGFGNIPPYSTLIFDIKLDSIVAFDKLPWRLAETGE